MPRIDHPAVDRGLSAHGVEPGAIGPGRGERMRGQRRIETGNRGGGALEAGGAIARRQV